jgi:biotin/methionine sulfoxide reductase
MPSFDTFWETGYVEFPVPDNPPVLFAAYRADPQAHPLRTPPGRIELFSETIAAFGYDDCPGHPVWLEPAEWLGSEQAQVYPLHLLSNQPQARLHSQLDCGEVSRCAKVAQREPVWINTDDAAARGITAGDGVVVENGRGWVRLRAAVTDAVRPGVVVSPKGRWAKLSGGRNVNWTTSDAIADVAGQSTFHSNLVEIRCLTLDERAAGEMRETVVADD